ncbi:MAG TPA: amidohydrolase family protein [Acidimicrobiales bacterium]|nr:amidohydrolase family protein [Acidimicrobiales bacterium]
MTADLVVRGGTVVDGTGAPARRADVAVTGGRIVEVGTVEGRGRREVDADGLTVTPGFIDIHTHYDAQLHFEPTASPSSWHGVTTVLTGNCGFTFAPAKEEDLGWLLQMLSRVEGMSPAALEQGVTFRGGSFADFLDGLSGRVAVNVGANVGHCALRRWVMGDEASERAATTSEVDAMCALLQRSLDEGAIGFTSSQLDLHVAHDGRPVPCNLAAPEELVALAGVMNGRDHGAIEFIPRTFLTGYSDDDRRLIRAMARASGKPVHLNTVTQMPHAPEGWKRSLEFAEEAAGEGAAVHPMFATNRRGTHFALGSTFLFDEMPTWRDTLTSPDRDRLLRDPAVRDRMRTELADPTGRSFVFRWEAVVVEAVAEPAHQAWVGRTVAALAAERGQDALDCFVDLSLAGGLRTQFGLVAPADPVRQAAVETLVRSPVMMAGSSDGGAHLLSFCGADFPTRLLTEWVPDVLTFEAAVARLTSAHAAACGLRDRGVVQPGAAADLVLLDRARLGAGDARYVEDFPAGSGRYVVDAEGYVAVIVNGTAVLEEGRPTGALPGTIIR